MIRFVIDTQPLPKQRPRVVNGKAYTPKNTRVYEDLIGWHVRGVMRGRNLLAGDLSVCLEFRRQGNRRADLDNLTKAVLDGLQGIAFQDDSQITILNTRVEYQSAHPGVTVTVQEIGS